MGLRYACIAFLLAAFPAGGTLAAPQILAALPDADGIALACDGGLCETSLSTLCLQKDKQIPLPGQLYHPARGGQFVLRLTDAAGNTRDVPATDAVRFATERDFVSVRVSIAKGDLDALGAVSARLIVADDAALVPHPDPADPNPLTEPEITYVTISVRERAAALHGRPDTLSAQALGRLVAALRAAGDRSGDEGRRTLDRLWDATLRDTPGGRVTQDAVDTLGFCSSGADGYSLGSIRRCLGYEHSRMIRHLNAEHWQNNPGS